MLFFCNSYTKLSLFLVIRVKRNEYSLVSERQGVIFGFGREMKRDFWFRKGDKACLVSTKLAYLTKMLLYLGMRTIILTFMVTVAFVIFQNPSSHSYSVQPPVYNAGYADQSSCNGSNCHNTNELNSGNGSAVIELSDDVLNYLPDVVYNVSLTIEQVGSKKFGFQMVAFDENDNSVGTFFGNETAHTATQNLGDIQFINHKNAPEGDGSYTFNMEWQAPAEDLGTINFYASANAADGMGGSTNDFIYTVKFAFPSTTDTNIASFTVDEQITVYPNPTNGILNIDSENKNIDGLFLYSAGGQLLQTFPSSEIIDLTDYDSVVYFLKILADDAYLIKKIIR